MRFLPVNRQALMVELADLDETLALLGSLQREPIDGVQELVPAARTVLVQFAPARLGVAELVRRIAARDLGQRAERSNVLVEIPVHYDGEDLADVAQLLGITPEEVVRRHTGSEYAVAFTGFAPGFAYLSGGDPIFNVPRRTTPRTRVPAGSVALGGTFSAVYPQASPGGWQLIGRTSARMWDLARELPALLQPGYRVRFADAAGMAQVAEAPAPAVAQAAPHEGNALRVKATGLMTLFHVLETVGGGLSLQSQGETVVAITGADAPLTVTTGSGQRWSVPRYQAVALADGDQLTVGQPVAGARCYVAVRGGFAVTPVLGSACTDTLANVGPAALAVGQVLPVRPADRKAVAAPELPPESLPTTGQDVVLDVELGPRTDWFTPEAVALLAAQRWQVTPQSNRVGLRVAGEQPLARAVAGELPSEGTPLGAIQVPPSGQPVLFLADHPLTGGYPVIGCVAPHHLDLAGQIPVGAWIRFNPIRAFEEYTPGAQGSKN
ncbi:MAG: 5-oxoprolinase/urea amidolyase family protein [Delftia acidovorans]|nr:5-oxoprolinase/urea amidolyase family protein [Delftia acidovorans]